MKQNYRLSAKQNVPENALFDETTCHIFVEEDGQVIEKKYCSYCHDWHPLSEYYYHKHSFDKLNCWCKPCMKKQHKLHMKEVKSHPNKNKKPTTVTKVDIWVVSVSA